MSSQRQRAGFPYGIQCNQSVVAEPAVLLPNDTPSSREWLSVALLRRRNAPQALACNFVHEDLVALYLVVLRQFVGFAIPWTFRPNELDKTSSIVAINGKVVLQLQKVPEGLENRIINGDVLFHGT